MARLLVVREFDQVIVQASENAAAYLDLEMILQGARLRSLGGNLWERTQRAPAESLREIPIAVRCLVGQPARPSMRSFIAPPAANS